MSSSTATSAFWRGARDALPFLLVVGPFALLFGVVATEAGFAVLEALAQFALRWILMSDAVSCVIPGAKRPEQVEENCRASSTPRLPRRLLRQVREIYESRIRDSVHQRW